METRHLDTGLKVEYRLGEKDPDNDQRMACIRTSSGENILVLLWGKSDSNLEGAISAYRYKNESEVSAVLPTGEWTTNVSREGQKPNSVNWSTVNLLLDFEEAVSNKQFVNISPSDLKTRGVPYSFY